MSKTAIGLLFILAGAAYGLLAIERANSLTLGWLVRNGWVKAPPEGKIKTSQIFGPKSSIIFYSGVLIATGFYILWNRNI